jgi:hypothetical protein
MSVLETLQQTIADKLNADPLFASARVLPGGAIVQIQAIPEHIHDVVNKISIDVQKIGIVAVVRTVQANIGEGGNKPGPTFDAVRVSVRVIENVIVNRGATGSPSKTGSLISATTLAERILSLLHYTVPTGWSAHLHCVDPALQLISPDEQHTGFDCNFALMGSLLYNPTQLGPLSLVSAGGMVTITSSTGFPGEAVFYTVDGTLPSPRNGHFYTAPFAASPGARVRARSWLAGYLTADLQTITA